MVVMELIGQVKNIVLNLLRDEDESSFKKRGYTIRFRYQIINFFDSLHDSSERNWIE
jgi:hypothetical protein